MIRLLKGLLPLSLLLITPVAASGACSQTCQSKTAHKEKSTSKTDKSSSTIPNDADNARGLDRLCHNHYNQLRLEVGKFEGVNEIIDNDKKASIQELKTQLSARKITLYAASWGLYYLGQKSLNDKDFKHFVTYLSIAADDYLNPWAMTLLAKVYFYDRQAWRKQFPNAEITTDKDLGKSLAYLSLAFAISGEIEKDHQDNSILTGVTNGGLALLDTFEGTGVSGFDAKAALAKKQKDLLDKALAYKKMYEAGNAAAPATHKDAPGVK